MAKGQRGRNDIHPMRGATAMEPVSPEGTAASTSTPGAITGTPADPWDAPYFGAPVYLAYRPDVPAAPEPVTHPAGTSPTTSSLQPLNMLYFGGPIYDTFPPFGGAAAPTEAASAPVATGPALDTTHLPYFGGPTYTTYDPAVPGFRAEREPEPVASSAAGVAASDAAAPAAAPPEKLVVQRRGWFARLFGQRTRA